MVGRDTKGVQGHQDKNRVQQALKDAAGPKRDHYLGVSRRLNLSPDTNPDDILQIALLELWEKQERIRAEDKGGNPNSVIYGHVYRRGIDNVRRDTYQKRAGKVSLEYEEETRRSTGTVSVYDQTPAPVDLDQDILAAELLATINHVLDGMKASPLDRFILAGSAQEKTYEEIAAECNGIYIRADKSHKPIDANYVKSRLLQIRKSLAKKAAIQKLRAEYNIPEKKGKKTI